MLLNDKTHHLQDDVQGSENSSVAQNGQLQMPALTPVSTLDAHTDELPAAPQSSHTEPLRTPVLIPGSGKKSPGLKPPKARRYVVSAGVAVLLVAILLGTLFAVIPTGDGQANGSLASLFVSKLNGTQTKSDSTALIAAQAATATAVTQDGYDAGNQVYAGVQSAPTTTDTSTGSTSADDQGSLDRFFYGQCTYWANMRYHELTGHWVPWLGNAYEWSSQASAYDWTVSSTPNPSGPSIVVLAPGVDGAGSYGHVAVVESGVSAASAEANGVLTSNWNFPTWASETWETFALGSGVTFVWYPS